MDLFTRNHLIELSKTRGEHCVSLYIPTHRSAPETRQDPIRFKNLLREATRDLERYGLDARQMRRLLEPAQAWLEDARFWRYQSDGLAVFLTEGTQQRFRLPREFDEQVRVGDHFYLNPLLPLLQSNGAFYVLAVSQKRCRLFTGDRDELRELDEAHLPHDLRSALGWWRERELNLHSMQRKPQSRGGDDTAIYHGHYEDTTKADIAAYFRRVDAGVTNALRGEKSPLVFAGVDYLFPIYRDITEYAPLCDEPVTGNPDDAAAQDLHRRAWEVVQPIFERQQRAVLADYGQRASHGTATDAFESILRSAHSGLVETLVIAEGARQWGCFDQESGHVELADEPGSGTRDLIDQAVLWTLETSGDVLAVDTASLPPAAKCLALLRAPQSTTAR